MLKVRFVSCGNFQNIVYSLELNDKMNQRYTSELYDINGQEKLRIGMPENQPDFIGLQLELYEAKNLQRINEQRILSQDRIIYDLKVANNRLLEEVFHLRNHNMKLELLTQNRETIFQNLPDEQISCFEIPAFLEEKTDEIIEKKQLLSNTQCDDITLSQMEKTKQISRIAMKLKLNKAKTPAPTVHSAKEPLTLRIFVGNLSRSTDEKMLREYFKRYGDVSDVHFPKNSFGELRGFAFVTFSCFNAEHPLEIVDHVIDGKTVFVDTSSCSKDNSEPTDKLMVSGTIQNVSNKTLIDHFSKFGKVVKIYRSKETKSRFLRWAFVQFNETASVDKALENSVHLIDGEIVDCRRYLKGSHSSSSTIRDKKLKTPVKTLIEDHSHSAPKDIVEVKKLCIHNLAIETTTEKMINYFSKFGTIIDAYIPTVYGTNISKGFGYIIMPSKEANFNYRNHIIDEKQITILEEIARSQSTENSTTLLVSAGPQVMMKVSEDDLRKFFSRFGKIKSVRKKMNLKTMEPCHYSFIEFTTCDPVNKAMANIAYKVNGNIISISKSRYEARK